MHVITYATPESLRLEIGLPPGEDGLPRFRHDDAATLMLLYSEGSRLKDGVAPTLEEAHETFRKAISERFGVQMSIQMTYLIVETIIKVTSDAKKKLISDTSSKSSESPPVGSPKQK